MKTKTTRKTKWHQSKDPLYRGDGDAGVTVPVPAADDSIVRHVLYLGGLGRETPYSSTSEVRETAEQFGRIWKTTVAVANGARIRHISQIELRGLLKGKGKGKAKWDNAVEVLQARRYVEQHAEHLLDFSPLDGSPRSAIEQVVSQIFVKG